MARTRLDLVADALEIAGAHLRARRLDHAATAYRQVLQVDPDNTDGLVGLGGCLLAAGQAGEALPYFARTLEIAPTHADALTNRGIVYMAVTDLQAAERDFRAVTALQPNDGSAWANLAGALAQQNRLTEAAHCFEHALKLAPDSFSIPANYARMLLLCVDGEMIAPVAVEEVTERVETLLDAAIQAAPDRAEPLILRAWLRSRQSRADEALALLDRAILLDPGSAEGYIHKGNVLMGLGRWRQAAAAFDIAAPMSQERHLVEQDAARCWAAQGAFEAALSRYARALASNPAHRPARLEFAQCLTELGRISEARDILAADAGGAMAGGSDAADHLLDALRLLTRQEPAPWRRLALSALAARPSAADDDAPAAALQRLRQAVVDGAPITVDSSGCKPADIVLLAACLPDLAARTAALDLRVRPDLVPLFARLRGLRSAVPQAAETGAVGRAPADGATMVPLQAVPALLDLPAYELPQAVPYLAPDAGRPRAWPARLLQTNQYRVGLNWRGHGPQGGAWPAVGLEVFDRIAEHCPDWHCYSLATGLVDRDRDRLADRGLVDLVDLAADSEDLLALLGELDLIIGPDGFVTRLAAAAGRPVAMLLPVAPAWIWGRQGEGCRFLPSVTPYRQSRSGDWTAPLDRILADRARQSIAS